MYSYYFVLQVLLLVVYVELVLIIYVKDGDKLSQATHSDSTQYIFILSISYYCLDNMADDGSCIEICP